MFDSAWSYALPFLPLASRFVLGFYWHWLMGDALPEAAQDRDAHRTVILGLAGFSFTAVAGLAVLDATNRPGFQVSIWYVLVSFISYLSALNLQSYKVTRWQNVVGAALIEMGSLSLILTVVSLVSAGKFSDWFRCGVATIGIGAWMLDHIVRLCIENSHFMGEDARRRKGGP